MGNEVLSLVIKLFKEWDNSEIRYCHWKGNEHLFEAISGATDCDVLVDHKRKDSAEKILHKLGYIKMFSQYGSRYPYVEDWLGCDEPTGELIHIHLHYQIVSGHIGIKEYTLPFAEHLLDTRVLHSDYPVWIADPNLELVMLYSRIGIKADYKDVVKSKANRYVLSNHDVKEIEYLRKIVNWDKISSILSVYYQSDLDKMQRLMQERIYDSRWLIKLKSLSGKAFNKYKRTGAATPVLELFYVFTIYGRFGIKKYLFPNMVTRKTFGKGKGAVIAVVGQDGAGKSTVCKDLKKWLSWKVDVSTGYLGSGDHYHSWQKLLVEKLSENDQFILRNIRSAVAVSNLKKLSKRNYRIIKQANSFANKGGVTVLDRYPQNKYIGINDGPKIPIMMKKARNGLIKRYLEYNASVERNFIEKCTNNSPDLIIKLMLPIDESLKRKPEEDEENIRKKHEIINNITIGNSESIVIDATLPYEEELVQIHNAIWNLLLQKQQI